MKLDGRKLRVGPFTVRIWADRDAESAAAAAGASGAWLGDELKILIDRRSAPLRQLATLLHEAMHGLWEDTPLDKQYTDEQEETIILTLERGLVQVLRDNPWFVDALMEAE